jgi:BlaI family penicillinase repressor
VSEGECIAAESESFLDRVFGGSLKPLLAHFADTRKLSPAEIAELKRLLKKSEEK